jgi:uncharacterized membrane protein
MPNDSQSSSSQSVARVGVLAGAGALILYGLTQRSKTGIALATAGSLIAYRGAQSNGRISNGVAEAVFRVNASPAEAYRLWRDFSNLPRFMAHLDSVQVTDERHSVWTAKGPLNTQIQWSAEITDDQPDRRIAWTSLPGSQIANRGWVQFDPDPQGRGTFVRAHIKYAHPFGAAGRALVTALGKHPEFVVKEDLRRFKALLETGETPTTAGQTHGPRGLHGHMEQALFRETSNLPRPQARPDTANKGAAA